MTRDVQTALKVQNLKVRVGGKEILKGVNLELNYGEIHAVMGPNGSGKSTLAYTIMGREGYEIVEGDILFDGVSIKNLPADERALRGLFLGFQEPPSIPGVRFSTFLIAVINKRMGAPDLTTLKDPKKLREIYNLLNEVGLNRSVLSRELNVGFSGGEKKRSEMLQALLLDPKVIILDEPDSGLDVDGVRKIAEIIKELKAKGKAILLITHYARLFNFVEPDKVTVLVDGKVAATGGPELAHMIEEKGYQVVRQQ
ncbi:MAG: Fe-S cluster assembly ATPase SufC [Desulfurococcales archaeon]|nr:Fe-S cluster assembly ATPase SufC [Desulfurococcales archaeon]MCE4622452.1 Fe-S cluster assembly ATPase SufC [Desulfurococcales archaeon]MCE4627397.1 Fe-S cluster assembly ATPase SufC [Desulfurococcales archaeon]MCE4629232.1 Fe-S cluster assembly ATPase SufC [Desulfurococcales archaeon]